MYGLIHKAIRDCVKDAHGEETWRAIATRAGADDSVFVSMESYPDETTYGLIAAACEELKVDTDSLLRAFGRFWVLHTAKVEYGPLLDFGGTDLQSFLKNLDRMHEQVAISFADLQAPSFELQHEADGSALLHYRSMREGLSEFVTGLLDGLSTHFSEPLTVEHVEAKSDGADHDVFRLRIGS
ncbi:MAG: heme NO-binding domain-containing protein [Planctomycetes bacterium]|nr:heme NO-binding domain-containing protein [Planctomycetota bacterium]